MPQGSFGYNGGRDQQDDLYEGFNYSIDLAPPSTGKAPPTGGAPPGSSYRGNLASQMGRQTPGGRLGTGAAGTNSEGRPMTSVSGAGFSSNPRTAGGSRAAFDPMGEARKGPAPALATMEENSPEEKAKTMEAEVHVLIEASAEANVSNRFAEALDLAKDAGKKERALSKYRTSNSLDLNSELTYGVLFNLANAYHANEMLSEAINSYTLIVKNKSFANAGRLRVNMGNIYYEQQKYPSAIKMYRMALDQIPTSAKEVRYKIMRNIGNAFTKLGQFQDAIQSYEEIMENCPDLQSGFNCIVCYYAIGDADLMRRGFAKLVAIPMSEIVSSTSNDKDGLFGDDDDDEENIDDDPALDLQSDGLKAEVRERTKRVSELTLTAARLCAPVLDRQQVIEGYDWVINSLKKSEVKHLASEMEICKAVHFLKEKQFDKAVDLLKSFEKKDQKLKAMAAINLSFLYFIEGDVGQADKYANMAVKHQRYNAKALVNKGNCLLMNNDFDRAKELYLEAIGVEADCVEAIYNLGLVNKQMGSLSESLQAFEKLHSILPNNTEVIFQIANLHDMMNNSRQASKWFNILLTCFGSSNSRVADPGVLSRLGQIFTKEDDETQAFHYHLESYRHFPVNLDVISWLGVWYVKSELYEKAIQFFERASQIQPSEVKWRLMVTSCYRRMGSYSKALSLYEKIHSDYPENLECLRYLVAICKDLGQPYEHHQQNLAKLERLNAARTQASGGGALTRIGGSQENNASYQQQQPPPQRQQHQQSYREEKESSYHPGPETRSSNDHVSQSKKNNSAPKPMSAHERNGGGGGHSPVHKLKQQDLEQSVDDWSDADVGDLLGD